MSGLYATTVLGFCAGVLGTGLGGLVFLFVAGAHRRLLSILMGFSGGIMITIVCLDLIPGALDAGGLFSTVAGIGLGTLFIAVVDAVFPGAADWESSSRFGVDILRTGILLGIGIAAHNFPEGLAIGSGYVSEQGYGIALAVVMAIHNIPEGMAMAAPMRVGGLSGLAVLFYTVLAGVPMGIGAFLGNLLGWISPQLIALSLGFAGGAMLYITLNKLLPDSRKLYRGHGAGLGTMVGIVAGIIITVLI
jgi:ZIP family zinc transporter